MVLPFLAGCLNGWVLLEIRRSAGEAPDFPNHG